MERTSRRGRPRKPRDMATLAGQLGERVEAVRKTLGMSQQELAHAAGVGLGTVARIEAGAVEANVGTVAALATALKMTGAELMKGVPLWDGKARRGK